MSDTSSPAPHHKVYLWEWSIRIFHWALVAAVIGLVITGNIGGNAMKPHGLLGLLVIGLITFRVVLGFFGGHFIRFSSFIRGPKAIIHYLKGSAKSPHGLGHNPLGALSVVALLSLMAAQAILGLFSNDDIAFDGPLYSLISKDLSDKVTGVHILLTKLIYAVVALHVAAIAFYTVVKKDKLVHPMISGWKKLSPHESGLNKNYPTSTPRAIIFAIVVAVIVVVCCANVAKWI